MGFFLMFVYFLYEFMAFPTYGECSHQWVVDHGVYHAKKNGGIVIAQQKYFDALRNRTEEPFESEWHFETAKPSDLSLVRHYEIPKQIEQALIDDSNGSWTEAWVKTFTVPHEPMASWLEDVIEEIGKTEAIDAFIVFQLCKSLEIVAGLRGIPVIYWDGASFRQPVYKPSLGYLDFKGVQSAANEASERYSLFKKEKELTRYILSPKEILALFLADDYLHKIKEFDQAPAYDWGIALSGDAAYIQAFNNSYTINEFMFDTLNNIDPSKSLIRSHPVELLGVARWQGAVDASPDTESFILQCKRIAVTWSKTAFLSMLWGKPTHIIKTPNSAFSEGAAHSFDTDSKCAEDDFVSFITFGYFVPLEFLNDPSYLRWRISKPAEKEIYMKNLAFLFSQKGIDLDAFSEISGTEARVAYLLNNRHDYLMTKALESTAKYEARQVELDYMLASVSWKITKPLRWLRERMKSWR